MDAQTDEMLGGNAKESEACPRSTIVIMFVVSTCAMFNYGSNLYYINTALVPLQEFVNRSLQVHRLIVQSKLR